MVRQNGILTLATNLNCKINLDRTRYEAYTMSPRRASLQVLVPDFGAIEILLWTPAQRKRASMLYFANVFFIYLFIFYGRLILRPWLTEVRESFTRGGP